MHNEQRRSRNKDQTHQHHYRQQNHLTVFSFLLSASKPTSYSNPFSIFYLTKLFPGLDKHPCKLRTERPRSAGGAQNHVQRAPLCGLFFSFRLSRDGNNKQIKQPCNGRLVGVCLQIRGELGGANPKLKICRTSRTSKKGRRRSICFYASTPDMIDC